MLKFYATVCMVRKILKHVNENIKMKLEQKKKA